MDWEVEMRPLIQAAILTLLLTMISGPLSAQWPPYPSSNAPRMPDGTPDLEGPTPRTADGKPDLTGVWIRVPGERTRVEDAQLGRAAAEDRPSPPPG